MNDLLCRILRSVILIPFAIGLFITTAFVLGAGLGLRDEFVLVWSAIFTTTIVVFYWITTWRPAVSWTAWRKIMTGVSIVLLMGVFLLGLLVSVLRLWQGRDLFMILGLAASLLGIPLWLFITLAIWRETSAERVQRLQASAGKALFCPKCGYNMTGLYESRCPECGERFTLDQLLAGQQRTRTEDLLPPVYQNQQAQ